MRIRKYRPVGAFDSFARTDCDNRELILKGMSFKRVDRSYVKIMKYRSSLCFFCLLLLSSSSAEARRQSTLAGPSLISSAVSPQDNLNIRITELSKQISDGLSENQKRTIAVVEFGDLRGNVTDFGRFVAEELITRLYQTKKFKVIERQLLNKVIAEQKLSLTGVIEQSAAQRLGKVLGVDAIASGTVTDLGEALRVNARLIDTATGEIFAVASAEIIKDNSVRILTSGSNLAREDRVNSSPPNAVPTASKSVVRATVQDLVVEITTCKRSRDIVLCEPTVTNVSSEDRLVFLWGSTFSRSTGEVTRAVDEFGTEYKSSDIALGSASDAGIVRNILAPQLPMKMKIPFANVSPEAKTIASLRIYFSWRVDYAGRNQQFFADLRNVPIVR